MNSENSQGQEVFKRLVKYVIEGLAVALVTFVIPKQSLDLEEVVMIALTAAATFAVLDTFSPAIASGARKGTGFGVGLGLSGYSIGGNPMVASVPQPAPGPLQGA